MKYGILAAIGAVLILIVLANVDNGSSGSRTPRYISPFQDDDKVTAKSACPCFTKDRDEESIEAVRAGDKAAILTLMQRGAMLPLTAGTRGFVMWSDQPGWTRIHVTSGPFIGSECTAPNVTLTVR